MWPFKKRKPKPLGELGTKYYSHLAKITEEAEAYQQKCSHPAENITKEFVGYFDYEFVCKECGKSEWA